MRLFVMFAVLSIPFSLSGQADSLAGYSINFGSDLYFGGLQDVKFMTRPGGRGIEGTRFVFEDFIKSNVYFSNKSIAPDRLINYDCYMDQVVYSDSSGNYVLNNYNIDFIEFRPESDSSVFFRRIVLPEEKDIVFMKILYEGESSLYKRYAKKLVISDEQPTFNYSDRHANEYIVQDSYYIRLQGKKTVEMLPSTKRALLKMMRPHDELMKIYMKSEKIRLKDESNLIKLIDYYDKLSKNGSVTQL